MSIHFQQLEKVEFLIATKSDDELELLLDKFLCEIIQKLQYDSQSKQKVMQICSHINKRISHTKLPTQKLIKLYQESNFQVIKTFCTVYIEKGKEWIEDVYELLQNFHAQKQSQQAIFSILINYELNSKQLNPFDLLSILDFGVLLMLYAVPGSGHQETAFSGVKSRVSPLDKLPQAMSKEDVVFVTNNLKSALTYSHEELIKAQMNLLKLLETIELIVKDGQIVKNNLEMKVDGPLVEILNLKYFLLLISQRSNYNQVQFLAETLIKKSQFIENNEITSRIITLYSKVDAKMKLKLLEWLRKKNTIDSQLIQVVNDTFVDEKLLINGVQLIQVIAQKAKTEFLQEIGQKIIDKLKSLLENGNDAVYFDALGLLVKRVPELIENDISLIRFIFSKFGHANPSVRDCLLQMLPAYSKTFSIHQSELAEIVSAYIKSDEPHARYAALKLNNILFPFDAADIRLNAVRLCTDQVLYVREEAYRGLVISDSKPTPSIAKLVELNDGNPDHLPILLRFLRNILTHSLIRVSYDLQLDWEPRNEQMTIDNRAKFKKALSDFDNNSINSFLELCGIGLEKDNYLASISAYCILELVSMGTMSITQFYGNKVNWLSSFLNSSNIETRNCIARVLGIVLAQSDNQNYFIELQTKMKEPWTKRFDEVHGAFLASCYIFGRTVYSNTTAPCSISVPLSMALKLFDSKDQTLILGAVQGYCEIARYCKIENTEMFDNIESILHATLRSTSDLKIQEAIVMALGHQLIGTKSEKKLDKLFELPSLMSKQVELFFNIGESLIAAIFGFRSSNMEEFQDVPGIIPDKRLLEPLSEQETARYIEKILAMAAPAQSAVNKKAATIWILCCVKYCSKITVVHRKLKEMHDAFSKLLGDKDDFTQEIASKGIGLIYDIGDSELKAELVLGLVDAFTNGRKIAAQSVQGNTELFTNGALGNTPDGQGITTYDSILSLAADMNQPDLVYKFMSLASHHAIWNSRRGASMGFSSIAAQAEKELKPYLSKIVPKLYRYMFDPHPKTALGMKEIWSALVRDSKTIEQYFSDIMDEVLRGMVDRQWRVRESSCGALGDLIQGKRLEQLEPYMKDLWQLVFRVLDDIKESVRNAALKTAKSLTSITTRYCDPLYHEPKKSQKIMDEMMPFLLNQGLANMAEEVRNFSLATILKLCKVSGVLLKPHVSNIICIFLESLSSLEPNIMSYLSFHTESYSLSQQDLDSSRLSAARNSPIMDAIQQCVSYLDQEILFEFTPKFCGIIKKGVGLPTRSGCARLVYILVLKMSTELRIHADSILKALAVAVEDRNPMVRKSFSSAVGYIIKLCGDKVIQEFAQKLREKYLLATDEDGRSVAPVTFLEISLHSQNVAMDIQHIVLPLAFMGSRDTAFPKLADIWKKVWEENTGGSVGAIRKWKTELFDSCVGILKTNPSYSMKKQVGSALVEMAHALKEEIIDILPEIIELVSDALKGRTWDGKETVLQALSECSIQGAIYLQNNASELTKVEDVMIREAKKNNLAYRRNSILFMGNFFDGVKSERFSDIKDFLVDLVTESESDMDIDEDTEKPLRVLVQANAFKAIGLCFPHNLTLQEKEVDEIMDLLGKSLVNQIWNIRVAILESLTIIFKKLDVSINLKDQVVLSVLKGCASCLSDGKYRTVKVNTLSFLDLIHNRKELAAGESFQFVNTTMTNLANEEKDIFAQKSLLNFVNLI